jgi:serine/threonine protein kinase
MGAVWEGWDERLRRPVALKILHAPQGAGTEPPELVARRAMREARLAARLHHRHAVTIYDVVEHEGQPCLVLELVPSQPLSEILSELTTLHEQETATLGAQVASALAAAHAAGIVHRDVKPANILVADDGTARISDFGIAHAIGDSTVTSTGMLTGTPAYLAPEVARGAESGYASDVFSLGSTLYATLEGRPPFGQAANQIGLLHRVAEGHVEPPQHAGALTPLLRQMLSTDIGARPTMAEVADRLHRLSTDPEAPLLAGVQTTAVDGVVVDDSATGSSGGVRVGPPISSSTSRRRRRVLGLVALLLLAALVVAGFVLLRPGAGNDSAAPPGVQDSPSASSTTSEVTGTATASAPAQTPAASPSAAAPSPTAAPSTAAPPASVAPTAPAAGSGTAPPTAGGGASPAVAGTPTAAQLAGAISHYYGLIPGNLDEAYGLLTTDYQTRVAGGRQAYQGFWDGFSKVTVTEVAGSPPSTATALITYTTKAGAVIRERTTFGLVNDGGVLKIARSTVTSRS